MKKIFAILLTLVTIISLLTGCEIGHDDDHGPTTAPTEIITAPTDEVIAELVVDATEAPTEHEMEAPTEAPVEVPTGSVTETPEAPAETPTKPETEVPAEEPPQPVHQHNYERKLTTPPTCSYGGEATYTCACGHSYTEAVPKNEHKWSEWVVTREPTATTYGKKARTCELCYGGQEANIDPLTASDNGGSSHKHSYSPKTTKEPTCTERGTVVYTCSCGDEWMEIISAKGHSWGDWVENGSEKTHTCSVCGATETQKITNVCEENGWSHQMSDADKTRVTRGAAYYNIKCLCGRHCHGSNRDEALANFNQHAAEKQWSYCGEIMAEWSGFYHEFPDSTYTCARCGTVAAYRRAACFSSSCAICYG